MFLFEAQFRDGILEIGFDMQKLSRRLIHKITTTNVCGVAPAGTTVGTQVRGPVLALGEVNTPRRVFIPLRQAFTYKGEVRLYRRRKHQSEPGTSLRHGRGWGRLRNCPC